MNKAVLISIRPEWCEKIISGKKTVEIRKTKPKLETPFRCYIYESSGNQRVGNENFNACLKGKGRKKVIGEFVCDEIEILRRNTIFNASALYSQSCLTREEYFNYVGNKTTYIWHISELVVYDKPKELDEFHLPCTPECDGYCEYGCVRSLKRPPQSWCYVEVVK